MGKTKKYHKMSGAADSLYSQDDLFFPVQADVAGAGGLQLRSVVVPFATFTGWDAILI
jgi:hypothetical protein